MTYCATGFLEKNNDTLQDDLRELVLSSRTPFLRQASNKSEISKSVPSRHVHHEYAGKKRTRQGGSMACKVCEDGEDVSPPKSFKDDDVLVSCATELKALGSVNPPFLQRHAHPATFYYV